jgi:hypothetical protein
LFGFELLIYTLSCNQVFYTLHFGWIKSICKLKSPTIGIHVKTKEATIGIK